MGKKDKRHDDHSDELASELEAVKEVAEVEKVEAELVSEMEQAKVAELEIAPAELMPVEKQEVNHVKQVVNPRAALQPGREFKSAEGLLGRVETVIHEARADKNHGLVADMETLLLKIGSLIMHLIEAMKSAPEDQKEHYQYVLDLLKK